MKNEEAVVVSEEPETHAEEVIHLVARNPQEMASAQANLASWFQHKVSLCETEVRELSGAVAEAKAHKWKSSTLESQQARALQRKMFYEKCLLAVNLGYTIIPDIPIDVFAIRVDRKKPRPRQQSIDTTRPWDRPQVPDETPQVMVAGEGRYESPAQLVIRTESEYEPKAGEKHYVHGIKAVAFDAIEFPIIAAVPVVMNATQQAMAERVFDQIGVSPQGRTRNADPLIIGQILGEYRGYSGRKTASFLIAWHLDLRTL